MFSALKEFKILPINFSKPWWNLIVQQKGLFVSVLLFVTSMHIFLSMVPFVMAKLFEGENVIWCVILFGLWFCADFLLSFFRKKVNTKFQLQCIHSVYQNAHEYLLTIDPHYHTHRSSGAVIAKIERAARGYEDFADHISFELTPLVVGLVTVVIALSYYSRLAACVMIGCTLSILAIGYYFAKYRCQIWEQAFIAKDDAFKGAALENLTQIQLIRSCFASNFRFDALHKNILENVGAEASLWASYIDLFTLLNLLYIFSLFLLALLLFWQISTRTIEGATALGLFLAYMQSSKEIVRFGRLLRKIMRSTNAIQDLFHFIVTFGKQSFPVLGQPSVCVDKNSEHITINAQNIHFDYGKAALFNDHIFKLTCNRHQPSKLYGIIGASGTGKTTLLTILGGQLKPRQGSVLINDIDIYSVNDAVRSQLIGLQGQIASNIRGTVKNNLLLGLGQNHSYDDAYLTDLLDRVGLLQVLDQDASLETMLGEGGLNLSGGQRQRLNFASLYLRACHYKPLVLLIDEPTSSLDELSEAAITAMIEQLAQDSITLVVAHRLKTIEKAVGIIDLSLLHKEKLIKPYNVHELEYYSAYYRALIQGKMALDN